MDTGDLRAGDADREAVAERLRIALDEGRLNLYEYDDRLREAFNAKTYNDLNALLADLPGVAPESRSQVVPVPHGATGGWQPGPDGRYPGATGRWLRERWESWFSAVAICTGIWAVASLFNDEGWLSFWPAWVAGPWGVVLLVSTSTVLSNDDPQRWAARRARKKAEREVRRQARRERGLESQD